MNDTEDLNQEMQMAEEVRPLVNEILERFNKENITPPAAGMVVLALISRLLEALEEHPEHRRRFVLNLITVINSYLMQEVGEPPASPPCSPGGPE